MSSGKVYVVRAFAQIQRREILFESTLHQIDFDANNKRCPGVREVDDGNPRFWCDSRFFEYVYGFRNFLRTYITERDNLEETEALAKETAGERHHNTYKIIYGRDESDVYPGALDSPFFGFRRSSSGRISDLVSRHSIS